MNKNTVIDEIVAKNAEFTPGEKKVARVVSSEYPAAGLLTIAELAKRSSVSGQTVLRFANKLGFPSFPAFQAQLIDELKGRHDSPLSLYSQRETGLSGNKLVHSSAKQFSKAIKNTFDGLPANEIDDAVELLSNERFELIATGGRFSDQLADYLIRHAHQMRQNTLFLPSSALARTDRLIDISGKTVLFVIDFRRYQRSTYDFAFHAHKCGAKIVLLTDTYLSPISQNAAVVLPVDVEAPSPFDSQVSATAVIELLIAGIVETLGENARKRIQSIEEYRSELPDFYGDR